MKALIDRRVDKMTEEGQMCIRDRSYHLSLLKKAGLIFESREKNFIYYSLNASVLEEVLLWLQDLKGEGKK